MKNGLACFAIAHTLYECHYKHKNEQVFGVANSFSKMYNPIQFNVKGKLVIFTAPSGAGKTTLVRHLMSELNEVLAFSVSATTRQRRQREKDGYDYYFITKDQFLQRVETGEFLEYQEVYDGNYYGTLKSEIQRIFDMDKSVIFDVDVQGALNIKKCYGKDALTIFVKPPSIEALKTRLVGRNSETDATLQQRLQKAIIELEYANRFDVTIINDQLEVAKQQAYQIVTNFLTADLTPSEPNTPETTNFFFEWQKLTATL